MATNNNLDFGTFQINTTSKTPLSANGSVVPSMETHIQLYKELEIFINSYTQEDIDKHMYALSQQFELYGTMKNFNENPSCLF